VRGRELRSVQRSPRAGRRRLKWRLESHLNDWGGKREPNQRINHCQERSRHVEKKKCATPPGSRWGFKLKNEFPAGDGLVRQVGKDSKSTGTEKNFTTITRGHGKLIDPARIRDKDAAKTNYGAEGEWKTSWQSG